MRSSTGVRMVSVGVLALALLTGFFAIVSAQEATPGFMSEMMMMEGACPEGMAETWLDDMMMSMEATEEAVEMAPEMELTPEMTEAPMMGPVCLFAELSGAAEVPGPGDEDGVGVAFVTIDAGTGEVCFEVAAANIELPAQAMHIHVGEEGVAGDVVVPLSPEPDAEGLATGCTMAEDSVIASAIVGDPEGYYVNVHTGDFPDGAVRGQLEVFDESMDESMMEEGQSVDVSLTEYIVDMPTTLTAGTVTFNIVNDGTEEHGFEIEGEGVEEELEPHLQPGETGQLTVELQPGTYTIYCPVEDHAVQGMTIEVTITGG